jgi:hypothetical protein
MIRGTFGRYPGSLVKMIKVEHIHHDMLKYDGDTLSIIVIGLKLSLVPPFWFRHFSA